MMRLGFHRVRGGGLQHCQGAQGRGLEGIRAYDKFWKDAPGSELICRRAAEAHVELMRTHQELVEGSAIIVSAVSAAMAVALAQGGSPAGWVGAYRFL